MVCKIAWSFSLCDKWYYVDCLLISHYSLPLMVAALATIGIGYPSHLSEMFSHSK